MELLSRVGFVLVLVPHIAVGAAVQGDEGNLNMQLEVIEVTAQKRQQNLNDVPVSVTAFDQAAFQTAGISSIRDLYIVSPSFFINTLQNKVANSPARIRGIGTTGTEPAFEGAVGFYVDGIYRSRSAMALLAFNDYEMLQVLRGPQGTLFGKNNSAGALLFQTTKPTDGFSAAINTVVGNYRQRRVSAFVNSPLSDKLIVRASVISDKQDGYTNNPFTGNNTNNIDTGSIKLQALYTLGETQLRLIADYNQSEQLCCRGAFGRVDPEGDSVEPLNQLYSTFTAGAPFYDVTGDTFNRQIVSQVDAIDEIYDWGITLDVSHQFGENLELGYLSAYREFTNDQTKGDWDLSPMDFGRDARQLYEFETISQELNLSGQVKLANIQTDFVLGLYYFHEDLHHYIIQGTGDFLGENFQALFDSVGSPLANVPFDTLAMPDTFFNETDFEHSNKVKAAYGHFTFALTDDLAAIAGIRYSEETKALVRTNLIADNPLDMYRHMAQNHVGFLAFGAAFNGPNRQYSIDEDEVTYTLGLQYFIGKSQFYATYARGYKAGGISLNNDAGGELVSIDNFGTMPTSIEDVILSPERDATYAPEYVDSYELGIKRLYGEGRGRLNLAAFRAEYEDIQASTFTGTQLLTYNADTALTQGIEIENTYVVTERLTNTVSLTWLENANFGDEPNEFQPLLPGRALPQAPEFASYVNFAYERDFHEDKVFYADINVTAKSKHSLSIDVDYEQSYTVWGMRAGVKLMNEALRVDVSCRNCLNKDYLLHAGPSVFQFHNPVSGMTAAPRTWHLTLNYDWE